MQPQRTSTLQLILPLVLYVGLAAGLTVCGGAGAVNVPVSEMYEAIVPPPPKGEQRDSAVIVALRQVAVKVSGDREAASRINVRSEWQLRETMPDGAVKLGFDRATVEQLLIKNGLPIWGRERPATLVWLSVTDANGRSTWADPTSAERQALERAAFARGLPLVWPALDAQDIATGTALTAAHSVEQMAASAVRYRADAVLLGIAGRDSSGAVRAQFTFVYSGEMVERAGALEDGVHLAADRCAKLLAVPANARSDVKVRVSGIADLEAYARTLNYLEALSIVRAVAVDQTQADVFDMRLTVRGDAAVLSRTIALDRRLSADGVGGDGALAYRFVN